MDFNKLSIAELKDAKATIAAILKERNAEVKEEAKAAKAEAKDAATEAGKAIAKVGGVVKFNHKGNPTSGRVVKIGEKTVTVVILDDNGDDVLGENGKPSKIWRYFYQIS